MNNSQSQVFFTQFKLIKEENEKFKQRENKMFN